MPTMDTDLLCEWDRNLVSPANQGGSRRLKCTLCSRDDQSRTCLVIDHAVLEAEDKFIEVDGHPICENCERGKIPTIPQKGTTAWNPTCEQQLVDRQSVWDCSRREHTQNESCNQIFFIRGLQHWNQRYLTQTMLKYAANHVNYKKIKKTITNLKGFGKKWNIYLLFQPRKDFIYFCRF